jgi:hypothetical protein
MSPHDDDNDNNDDDDDDDNWSSNNYFSQFYNASSNLPNDKKKLNERDYEEIYYHFDTVAQDVLLANANLLLVPPEPGKIYTFVLFFVLIFEQISYLIHQNSRAL